MTRRFRTIAAGVAVFLVVLGSGGCSDCDVEITTGELPVGFVGVDYRFELDSDCGGDVWFVDEGLLPPGIALEDDGDFEGRPIVAGEFFFTIGVFDFDDGDEAVKGFVFEVEEAP
jgi:hypothetical protein